MFSRKKATKKTRTKHIKKKKKKPNKMCKRHFVCHRCVVMVKKAITKSVRMTRHKNNEIMIIISWTVFAFMQKIKQRTNLWSLKAPAHMVGKCVQRFISMPHSHITYKRHENHTELQRIELVISCSKCKPNTMTKRTHTYTYMDGERK